MASRYRARLLTRILRMAGLTRGRLRCSSIVSKREQQLFRVTTACWRNLRALSTLYAALRGAFYLCCGRSSGSLPAAALAQVRNVSGPRHR
jgi:hypothetical protein